MLSKTYLHGYLNQKHIFINMNYKNFKICCNFCPRYIEMFQASVIAEKSWTKVNKNGWKNSFWKFPTEKFIWIQLLELLTDQNEAAIFGYSIKFYVKIELANCVRHLWDHSNKQSIFEGQKLQLEKIRAPKLGIQKNRLHLGHWKEKQKSYLHGFVK